METHNHTSHIHGALIEQLLKCVTACENLGMACLDQNELKLYISCIELSRDCSEICFMTVKLLTRDSEYAKDILELCGKICRHCAEACSKHEFDESQKCMVECNRCADDCHAQMESSL